MTGSARWDIVTTAERDGARTSWLGMVPRHGGVSLGEQRRKGVATMAGRDGAEKASTFL
jgi:hypothetical protein